MNLSFLNSFFLYFLPLFSIPFILHLLFRKKPVRIAFSHLDFIRIASRHAMPRSRVTQWLLLIIRSLIILLIIFLFSRPILHVGGSGESGEENACALVVMVNASYSMRSEVHGRTLFDRAKLLGIDIVEHLNPADRAAILIYSDQLENPSPALIADKNNLTKILKESSASFRTTDAVGAFALAFELLSESFAVNKGIIFLTDTAAHGWPEKEEDFSKKISHYDPRAHIIIIDCSLPAENIFIENIDLSPSTGGKKALLTWRVFNPNDSRFTDKEISLSIEGTRVSNRGMVLQPGRSTQGVMPFSMEKSGVIPAQVYVRSDSIKEDNMFYFHTSARPRIPVLCVDGDPEMGTVRGETYFLRLVLTQEKGASGIEVDIINQDQMEEADFSSYKVILLCNVGALPGSMHEKLLKFLRNGGGIGIFPGDKVKVDSYRDIGEIMPVEWDRIIDLENKPLFLRKDSYAADKFIISSDIKFELDKVKIHTFFVLKEKEDSQVPFRLSSYAPFLVVSGAFAGRVAVLAVPIDRDWSNIPAKPVYVPLLNGIVMFLAGIDEHTASGVYQVGEKIHINLPSQNIRVDSVLASTNEKIRFTQTGKRLSIEPIQQPGHYRIQYKTHKREKYLYFSVNVDRTRREGILDKIDRDGIQKFFSKSTITYLKNSSTVLREVIIALRGREISRFLVGLLVILLVIELLVAQYKRKSLGH